jgi:hypothetical protein
MSVTQFPNSYKRGLLGILDITNERIQQQFKIPEYLNYEWIEHRFVILKNSNHIILYSTTGYILFYKYDSSNPVWSFNTLSTLQGLEVNENDKEIYALSPNGTITCYDYSTVIISDVDEKSIAENKSFTISPNPATDYITISASNKGLQPFVKSDKVQIFDMLGIEVVIGLDLSTQRIDVSHLQPGVYFIRIGDRVEKFVKL